MMSSLVIFKLASIDIQAETEGADDCPTDW